MNSSRRIVPGGTGGCWATISIGGGGGGFFVIPVFSMVVGDLVLFGAPVLPGEADPPLVVDPDRMLALAVSTERVKLVARRQLQVIETRRGVEQQQLVPSPGENLLWKTLGLLAE